MKTKSFTLIELLVVIVIIGILAGVIIVSTSSSISKANFAKAQAFSNTVQQELLLNLVSEWTFDEGNAEDSWGNNDGVVTGATYQNKASGNCVYGGCYLFDGDDYIDCGDKTVLSITGDLTLSAWIKITSDSNAYYVIGKGSGNDYNQMWWIGATGTKNPIFVLGKVGNTSATYISSPEKLEVGKYYYILTTVSGSTGSLYIDGINKNEGNIASRIETSGSVLVGKRIDGYAPFKGYIDDVRVYNTALTTSEIKQEYIAGLNSLLANNNISKEEYNQRLESLSINY